MDSHSYVMFDNCWWIFASLTYNGVLAYKRDMYSDNIEDSVWALADSCCRV